LEVSGAELPRSSHINHGAKPVHTAFIKHSLPRVYGLPRYANGQCHLRRRLARFQQSCGLDPLALRIA
jgi:hypothetical protein